MIQADTGPPTMPPIGPASITTAMTPAMRDCEYQ